MKFTIGGKLALSFGAVIGLMMLSSGLTYMNVRRVQDNIIKVVDEATPTVRACDLLQNGINQSLAALRGYLILGDDSKQAEYFRSERTVAWQEIDDSLQRLKELSDIAGDESRRRVDQMATVIEDLRGAQLAVEEIGQTDQNVPSRDLLRTQIMPMADNALETLTAMIDAEQDQEASPQRRDVLKTLADLRGYFVSSLTLIQSYQFTGDSKDWQAAEAKWREYEDVLSYVHELESHFTAEQKQLWTRYEGIHDELNPLPQTLYTLRSGDEWNKAEFIMATRAMPTAKGLIKELDEVTFAEERNKAVFRDEMDASCQAATLTLVVATTVAIMLAGCLAFFITRQMVIAVRALSQQADAIAAGDLRSGGLQLNSSDEMGQLADGFNVMLGNLKDLTGQILSVTENVNSAASQVSSSAKQQASSTKEQAATVQEITSTMREIGQTGAQILEKARELSQVSEASGIASQEGINAVQEASRTMESIREQVEDVAENIVALSEKTQAIGDIVATVNEVAEQSNLLALNATIEAVSAGEQGSRFSVVANEMKNLADQAKQCTVQVRDILGEIQKGINSSVMLTEEAVKRVESGKERTQFTEATIRKLSESTESSTQAFEQIIGATNQQQIGFEQVTKGMEDIREATQQTAAGTSQLELAVGSLSAMSQQLKTAVGSYQVQ